jgi:AraC-like DNA-binding protein
MDIRTHFSDAFVSTPKVPSGHTPEEFLGHDFEAASRPDSAFFGILSGGHLICSSPYSFDLRSLDCFMLLHTLKGCGKLLIDGSVYTLSENTLLLFDCHRRFRLDIAIEPWEYQVLFITGAGLDDYYRLLPEGSIALAPVMPYSDTVFCLEKLFTLDKSLSLSAGLTISSLLNTVITNCIIAQLPEKSTGKTAPYLRDMKDLFDTRFQESFSLDDCAERFHISKYRLCREFKAAYGISPLQYLNHKRISYAQHLLLTTSVKVHEAGSLAGIENTNHFITLFKKFTGVTPLEFVKQEKGH